MKAEERKELQKNDLAAGIEKLLSGVTEGPSKNTVMYTVLTVVAIALVVTMIWTWKYFANQSEVADADRWEELNRLDTDNAWSVTPDPTEPGAGWGTQYCEQGAAGPIHPISKPCQINRLRTTQRRVPRVRRMLISGYRRITLTNMVLVTLKQWERVLPREVFCRIHRGYIVSVWKVQSFDNRYVYLAGEKISIGEQYRGALPDSVTILMNEGVRKEVFHGLGI